MSGIGHIAAGFVTKPATPKVPLVVLLLASEVNEILYFVFTLVGIEKTARYTLNFRQGIRFLDEVSNPWSHGLFMSVIYSLIAAGIAYLFYRQRRTAGVIGLVVFSHWVLDFLMHANLPLFFAGSPVVGLGLENSGPGLIIMTVLDLALVVGGLAVYAAWRDG